MRLGIIGLPQSGKTTVFNALTGQNLPTGFGAAGQMEVHTAVVDVPDARLNFLSQVFQPKKITHATVTYKDIGGLDRGIGQGGLSGPLRNELAQVDGFVHVLRAFKDEAVSHPLCSVLPERDLATIEGEFLLLDLIAVEGRLERLKDEWTKKPETRRQNEMETALMERLRAHLESERPLREMAAALTADEHRLIRGYGLLTLKPMLLLLNAGDDPLPPESLAYEGAGTTVVSLQSKLEAEIAQLDAEDRPAFLAEYGIAEPGAERVIRASYDLLGIHTFFTVVSDELRAWSLPVGGTALDAAGTVHTDMARGFIRAEVVAYADLVALGDMKAVRAAGKQRLEGRTYVVQDGDILTIRFNV